MCGVYVFHPSLLFASYVLVILPNLRIYIFLVGSRVQFNQSDCKYYEPWEIGTRLHCYVTNLASYICGVSDQFLNFDELVYQ